MSITSADRAALVAEPTPLVRPLVLWTMRLTALVAAAVSGYILSISLAGAGSVGCSGGFDCDEVLSSGWSTWFGLPVTIPALSLYVSLQCALAFAGSLTPERVRGVAWTIALWLSALAGAAALWFFGLQLFVVGAFCSWCLTVHMCGLGLAALALLTARNGLPRLQGAAAVALSGMAVLAVGQFVGGKAQPDKLQHIVASVPATVTQGSAPPTVTTQRLTVDDLYVGDLQPPANEPPTTQPDPPPVSGEDDPPPPPSLDDLNPPLTVNSDGNAPDNAPPAAARRRVVSLFRGSAQVDVYQHPVLGSPEAPYVIVKLFDYTCPHCREMHEHLHQACDEFGGDLVVIMCPTPLNKQCNPHVQFDSAKHAEACELARLALAVWQADPARFEEFDAWLFAPPIPPAAAAAREKAAALVGEKQLAAQLYGEELRARLAVGPKLYKQFGAGTVPKLVLPTGMLVGPGESTAAVVLELKKEFAKRPAIAIP